MNEFHRLRQDLYARFPAEAKAYESEFVNIQRKLDAISIPVDSIRKLGTRLAELLDDDQFNNIEPMLRSIESVIPKSPVYIVPKDSVVEFTHPQYGGGLFFTADASLDIDDGKVINSIPPDTSSGAT